MLVIDQYFVEELLVRLTEQLIEWRKFGRTVTTALTAVEECVNSLSIGCRDALFLHFNTEKLTRG